MRLSTGAQNVSKDHDIGLDALADGGQGVLIRIKDVRALVAAKGGGIGQLAQAIAPETIAAKVYSEMADKMKEGLTKEGVDADVKVVSHKGLAPVGVNPIWKPMAITFGSLLAGFASYKVVNRIRKGHW